MAVGVGSRSVTALSCGVFRVRSAGPVAFASEVNGVGSVWTA